MVNPETFLITNDYVRQALDQLIQVTASVTVTPLQFLQVVEAHILASDFSFFRNPRQFALNDLLVSIVRDQYKNMRHLHNLSTIQTDISLASAIALIKEDALTANPDLIGWAWLYFHYVEVKLRISQQNFCEYASLDDRTIRRYQNNTIDHLTKHFIRMEQQARVSRRKQLLKLQLPHQGTISNLIERDHELELLRGSNDRHFLILGAPGIGKTVFVEYFLQEKIENEELDHIVWFQLPEDTESITSYLKERLLTEETRITLAEFTLLKRVAIVIDDSEPLLMDLSGLQNFMRQYGNAYLFLMSRVFQPLPESTQINLHEFSLSATEDLLRGLTLNDYDLSDHTQLIWQSVGGNPLAIKLLAQNWPIFDHEAATILTLDQIFSSIYLLFTPTERLAWLILALMINTPSSLNDFAELEISDINLSDFTTLIRACIVTTTSLDNPNIKLTVSAYRYIQYKYETDANLQSSLESFLVHMLSNDFKSSDLTLSIAESILTAQWLRLASEYYFELADRFWALGISRGHYTLWHSVLSLYVDEFTTHTLEFVIGYGVCQRYLGQWSESYRIFAAVIEYVGRYGDFSEQAAAMLELAILLRYQGNYENAVEMLNHISVLPKDSLTDEIRVRLTIEHVELALENKRLKDAKDLVGQIPDSYPRKKVLQIEIYARTSTSTRDMQLLIRLSDKLLFDYSFSPSINARIHVLLGRIYEKVSDIETATKHLSIALSLLLEQDNDPFALARTQTNLAGLLIQKNRIVEAQSLLSSAKHIQRQIGDRVGMAATVHNERAADRKIVN